MTLQLLGSVREGGGGDGLALVNIGTGGRVFAGADLLQHLMASRIGQRLRDQVNLVLGKGFLLRHGRHFRALITALGLGLTPSE